MKIELPVNAHLPHDYVPGERLRLEAYRKIAAATDFEALDEVLAELVDRYGAAAGGRGEPAGGRPDPGPCPRPGLTDVAMHGQLHQVRPRRHREPARFAAAAPGRGCTRGPQTSRR